MHAVAAAALRAIAEGDLFRLSQERNVSTLYGAATGDGSNDTRAYLANIVVARLQPAEQGAVR